MAKLALITGAGSGLGRELALQLADRYTIVVADIDAQRAAETVALIGANGGKAISHPVDIGDPASVDDLCAWLKDQGPLHLLINNAGIASSGYLSDTDEAHWQRLININLMGLVRLTRGCLPLLDATTQTAICNIASFAAIAQMPGMISYNVTKAAVMAFSESLRYELLDQPVSVTVACPSFFATNLLQSMVDSPTPVKGAVEKWMQRSPVQAPEVAAGIIQAIDKGQFLVISHPQARTAYRIKQWFPGLYPRQLRRQLQRMKWKHKHTPASTSRTEGEQV